MPKPRKQKPWNKGNSVGQKPALTPDEVQAIRVLVARSFPLPDQLIFAVGIESSLRASDLVRLTVSDVCLADAPRSVVHIIPMKTAESSSTKVAFELAPETQKLLLAHIGANGLGVADSLFTQLRGVALGHAISEREYAALLKKWVTAIGLNPQLYGTHSIRRSRPAHVYRQTANLRICQLMLGHTNITTTQSYLGVEEAETLEAARLYRL